MAQFDGVLCTAGEGTVQAHVVEDKGNLDAVRAAERSVQDGRFPGELIEIDGRTTRCCAVCRLLVGQWLEDRVLAVAREFMIVSADDHGHILRQGQRFGCRGLGGDDLTVHHGHLSEQDGVEDVLGERTILFCFLADPLDGTVVCSQQLLIRDTCNVVNLGRFQAEGLDGVGTNTAGVLGLQETGDGTALNDGLVEKALCGRHRHQRGNLAAAARLTENGDVRRIAAERCNVVANPLKRFHDVHHADIAAVCILGTISGKVEETERVEAVIERNHDYAVVAGQVRAVITDLFLSAAGAEAATMQPDHDRTLHAVLQATGPDVDPEAVLVGEAVIPVHGKGLIVGVPASPFVLRTSRAVGTAVADFGPGIRILGRHETGRLGIRNALENENAVIDVAGHGA